MIVELKNYLINKMKSEMSDFITLSKHLSISMLFPPRNLNSKPISKSRKNTDEYMKFNKKNSEIDSELFGVKSIKNNNWIKEKRSGND